MTNKEKLIASKLLDMAYEEFSCHSCNDIYDEFYEELTDEEKQKLLTEYVEWNGDPDVDNLLHIGDASLMAFFADKLRKERL